MLNLRSYQIKNIFVFIIIFFSYFNYSQNDFLLNKQISDINNYLKKCESLNDTASKESELIARQALHISRLVSDKSYFYRSMLALSKALWAQGKQIHSSYYIDTLVKSIPYIKDNLILSDIRFIQGRYEHFKGMYGDAQKYYFEALNYSDKANDVIRIGEISNTIGGIFYNQEQSYKSFEWFRKSLLIQLKQKNDFRIGRGYLNTASALIQLNKLDNAKLLLDSSLYYYGKVNSMEGMSHVYATLPIIFTKQNKTDSALKYLIMARKLVYSTSNFYSLPEINYQIGKIYMDRKDFSSALKHIDEGLDYCKRSRVNFFQITLYQLKSELFERKKSFKEALEYHKLFKIYSDSVLNNESSKKQTQVELKYEFDKKQIEEQHKLDELNSKRTAEELLRNIILYSVLIIIVLISVFLFLRYKSKKRTNDALAYSNEKLKEKNIIIEENSKRLAATLLERELLLKEIHHRVKNNLQIISGLLELQKEELGEEVTKAAFDEGQSRVRSIALIHQNLYQHENLGSIEFKVFIKELASNIKEMFENQDQQMSIEIEVADQFIDIDTAVPLGLIINELLTNSFKYASKKNHVGKIFIGLKELLPGNFELIYTDDGPGISPKIQINQSSSLGLRLINGLTKQMAGNLEYSNNGFSMFKILFKDNNGGE